MVDTVTPTPTGFSVTPEGFRAIGAQLVDRDAWIRAAYACLAEHAMLPAGQ